MRLSTLSTTDKRTVIPESRIVVRGCYGIIFKVASWIGHNAPQEKSNSDANREPEKI
jgi:hypothetical protein